MYYRESFVLFRIPIEFKDNAVIQRWVRGFVCVHHTTNFFIFCETTIELFFKFQLYYMEKVKKK